MAGGTIRYRAQVDTPSKYVQGNDAGGWLWMQTLQYGSTRTLNDGTTVQSEQARLDPQATEYYKYGIDVNFGYEPKPNDPGTFTASDGVPLYYADSSKCSLENATTSDGPGEPLYGDAISYDFDNQFTTWLLYRPPGDGSQFVPLSHFNWSFEGTLTWDRSQWNLDLPPHAPHGPLIPVGHVHFPQWDRKIVAAFTTFRQDDAHTYP